MLDDLDVPGILGRGIDFPRDFGTRGIAPNIVQEARTKKGDEIFKILRASERKPAKQNRPMQTKFFPQNLEVLPGPFSQLGGVTVVIGDGHQRQGWRSCFVYEMNHVIAASTDFIGIARSAWGWSRTPLPRSFTEKFHRVEITVIFK